MTPVIEYVSNLKVSHRIIQSIFRKRCESTKQCGYHTNSGYTLRPDQNLICDCEVL